MHSFVHSACDESPCVCLQEFRDQVDDFSRTSRLCHLFVSKPRCAKLAIWTRAIDGAGVGHPRFQTGSRARLAAAGLDQHST